MMKFERLEISDVIKITPRRFEDDRGYFMETFRQENFLDFIGQDINFVQENQSLSRAKNTIRGLHYQSPPFAQGKLVRCISGSIVDVAVDVRKNSKTYGQYVTALLSAENGCQLWVPEGFLHGFSTLEADCLVQYKCTNYYNSEADGNVYWNDLGIDWQVDPDMAILSDKDIKAPKFKDFESPF